MRFHFPTSQPSAAVPQIPPFVKKKKRKRRYMCAGHCQFADGPGQCVASSKRALTGGVEQIKHPAARTHVTPDGAARTHLNPAECSTQRLPEPFFFFFFCSAKRCSGSVWRQTQSRQHIAGAPHWAAHSHNWDIRQPDDIYLSKMQKVFSAFRRGSRLKYAKKKKHWQNRRGGFV